MKPNPFYAIFDLATSQITKTISHVNMSCGETSTEVCLFVDKKDDVKILRSKITELLENAYIDYSDKVVFKERHYDASGDVPEFFTLSVIYIFE